MRIDIDLINNEVALSFWSPYILCIQCHQKIIILRIIMADSHNAYHTNPSNAEADKTDE